MVDPIPEYFERMKKGLRKNGINVAEQSIDQEKYGNGEGWYSVSLKNIEEWVVFQKYKHLLQSEEMCSHNNSLDGLVGSLVEEFTSFSEREDGPKSVLLVGEKYYDRVRGEFEKAGVKVTRGDFKRGESKGMYVVDLEVYFKNHPEEKLTTVLFNTFLNKFYGIVKN